MTLLIVNLAALLAVVAFISQYSVVRWERTQEGQNAMTVSLACLMLCLAGLARRVMPEADTVALAGYVLVTAAFVWRSALLIRAQRDGRRAPGKTLPPARD